MDRTGQERQEGQGRRQESLNGGRVGAAARDPPGGKGQKPSPRPISHEEKKRADAAARKRQRAAQARQAEIDALEKQIADCEAALREIEQTMASPGFYENREAAQPIIDRHQALMWQVGRPDAPLGKTAVRQRPRRARQNRNLITKLL